MRTFHIFNINDSVLNLTRNDSYPLFHSFLKIKNLSKSDISLGINIYEQLVTSIDKNKFGKRLYNHYRESDFYTKYRNNHTYINKYRDEKSYLYVNNGFMKLKSNREYPEFFKYLKKNKNLFCIDFDNMDYFWINEI